MADGSEWSASPGRSKIFSSPHRRDRVWGAPSLLVSGINRPGREAEPSPPTSAEAKCTWTYTSTPTHSLHGVLLNQLRPFDYVCEKVKRAKAARMPDLNTACGEVEV
jgi:hypothetical protein